MGHVCPDNVRVCPSLLRLSPSHECAGPEGQRHKDRSVTGTDLFPRHTNSIIHDILQRAFAITTVFVISALPFIWAFIDPNKYNGTKL